MKLIDSLWKMATMLLLGIVAGLVAAMKLMDPGSKITNIEAQNYTENEEQKVGKIKQKGKGNEQQAEMDQGGDKPAANREKRRQKRRERRNREKEPDKELPLAEEQYHQVSERLSGY